MDQHVQNPFVTRGRILLFALLAAFAWLLLSIFASGTAAVADDGHDDGLLGTLTATVEEVVPLRIVSETLNDVAEPLAPVTKAATPVVDPLVPMVEPITHAATALVEPVLDRPVISDTVTLLNDVVKDSTEALLSVDITESLSSDPLTSAEAMPSAATAYVPGPAAVKVTAVTPDTRAASVPAAGSLSSPQAPVAPTDPMVPAPAPTPSLGQTSGAPALVAALAHVGGPLTLAVASAASTTFALPTSPTFDNDSSPD